MIKTYTGLKGFGVLFLFIAGLVLFLSFFLWGITQVVELFIPVLIAVSYLLIIVFLLGILPATFIRYLRPSLSLYSILMSHALGVTIWLLSFIFVVKIFGMAGLFLAFLFQYLVPFALAAAMLKGYWHTAEHLSLWIIFSYGMKYYSQWLLNLNSHSPEKSRIIDVEVIEK